MKDTRNCNLFPEIHQKTFYLTLLVQTDQCTPRLEITCKRNKNCTEKIMVPLKFLRKRSSRFGATCWGITTHQANRADGLCKYCKGLPHPPAHASLWVVIPQHVAPNLELLFPNYFSGTYGISVQFFLIAPVFLTGWSIWIFEIANGELVNVEKDTKHFCRILHF